MAYTVEQLVSIGGSEWRKDDLHRVYFNNLPFWYGVRTERYQSGHISAATLDGHEISNSRAHSLIVYLNEGRLWYDMHDGKFHGQGLKDTRDFHAIFPSIVAAIKAEVARRAAEASVEAEHGIGRVPADVDAATELLAEAEAQRLMRAMPGAPAAGGFAPVGTTETGSAPDDTAPCTICGAPGWHNPGAGRALCDRHWDEY